MIEEFTEQELRAIRAVFNGFKSQLGVSRANWPLFKQVTDKVDKSLLTFDT